jgi:acyl-CoA thioesterase
MREPLPRDLQQRMAMMTAAPYATLLGMETVSLGEGEAVVRMATKDMTNALGSVHGGAVFSVADQAFALAANSEGEVTVALSASISYLRPAMGELEASARKVGESKSTSVYEVLVRQEGDVVAIFQGIGYKLRRSDNK